MRHEHHLPPEFQKRGSRPFILAHRGSKAQAPENTLPSFELALDQGADMLETDLRITRDRVIVCIHDATVDRTTDGTGSVEELTWNEIRQLRALGNNATRYPDARIPALAEVLERLIDRTYLALELKAPAFTHLKDVDLLLETLSDHGALDRVLALSFDDQILQNVKSRSAPFPVGKISAFNPWPSAQYAVVGPWWPLLLLNPLYVAISHRRGQFCCPLDPRPEPRLGFYLRLGVDALLSDDPEKTKLRLTKLLQ